MATLIRVGKKLEEVELLDLFQADEGTIDQIYGRIGQGKTYAATADILNRLKRGEVVYANWRVDFSGYDERSDFWYIIAGLFGFKRRFYKFDASNFHYLPLDDDFMEKFEKLTDCAVYLDEGHLIFDSYQHAKFSMQKRAAILHTRHWNRTIVIVSQRPTAIHVSARANVNRFFKVERWMKWPFLLFTKTEYQDMLNETVDETKPIRTSLYFGRKSVLNAYNSKYMRNGVETSQKVNFEGYKVGMIRSWALLYRYFFPIKIKGEDAQRFSAGVSPKLIKSSFPTRHDEIDYDIQDNHLDLRKY